MYVCMYMNACVFTLEIYVNENNIFVPGGPIVWRGVSPGGRGRSHQSVYQVSRYAEGEVAIANYVVHTSVNSLTPTCKGIL